MVYIRNRVYLGWCLLWMAFIGDDAHLLSCVHLGWCLFGMDGVHSGWCPIRIESIRYGNHEGLCFLKSSTGSQLLYREIKLWSDLKNNFNSMH